MIIFEGKKLIILELSNGKFVEMFRYKTEISK